MKAYLALPLFLAFVSPAWSQVDLPAIIRQSIANGERDWRATRDFAWTQTDTSMADGKMEVVLSEMIPLGGTPYERLLGKDGHPLSPEEQRGEYRKYAKVSKQRDNESPSERDARIRKYDNERAFMRDIPDAYDFTLLAEESIDGRPAWVVHMTPRSGFVPIAPHSSMLQNFEGTLWIDKQDIQWVKAEAVAIHTATIGWIVARIEPGTRFTFEQSRVADGLWMPKCLTVTGFVRVMMVYGKKLREEVNYSGYHLEKQLQAGTHQ